MQEAHGFNTILVQLQAAGWYRSFALQRAPADAVALVAAEHANGRKCRALMKSMTRLSVEGHSVVSDGAPSTFRFTPIADKFTPRVRRQSQRCQ